MSVSFFRIPATLMEMSIWPGSFRSLRTAASSSFVTSMGEPFTVQPLVRTPAMSVGEAPR